MQRRRRRVPRQLVGPRRQVPAGARGHARAARVAGGRLHRRRVDPHQAPVHDLARVVQLALHRARLHRVRPHLARLVVARPRQLRQPAALLPLLGHGGRARAPALLARAHERVGVRLVLGALLLELAAVLGAALRVPVAHDARGARRAVHHRAQVVPHLLELALDGVVAEPVPLRERVRHRARHALGVGDGERVVVGVALAAALGVAVLLRVEDVDAHVRGDAKVVARVRVARLVHAARHAADALHGGVAHVDGAILLAALDATVGVPAAARLAQLLARVLLHSPAPLRAQALGLLLGLARVVLAHPHQPPAHERKVRAARGRAVPRLAVDAHAALALGVVAAACSRKRRGLKVVERFVERVRVGCAPSICIQ